jgi:exosortase/archaeosortase family protein
LRVAVIGNDLRVLGIVLIAHFIGNAQAIETGHVLWGWLFYVIIGAVLVVVGLRFRQTEARRFTSTCRPRRGAPVLRSRRCC